MERQVYVVRPYRSEYTKPWRMSKGEQLLIGDKFSQWEGWLWCANQQGMSGWVPARYLRIEGDMGIAQVDYEATELEVDLSDLLTFGEEESGWFWCTNQAGNSGWVPAEYLEKFDLDDQPISLNLADRVLVAGIWELRIFYREKGTRSEGQHGVLLREGQVLEPGEKGQEVDTDLGLMKYYLHPRDLQGSFQITGWNFADPNKFLSSWDK